MTVLHLYKLINTLYCNHLEKLTTTSPPIDSTSPIARPTIKSRAEASNTKQKRDQLTKANGTSKCTKKS